VAALVPDQVGVGVFSPLIDQRGNSVRGMNVCQELSERLGFHLFRNRVDALPPIKSVTTGDVRHSLRIRPLAETQALKLHGTSIAVIETQGPWSFVSCERLMRRVDGLGEEFLIIDTTRIGAVDHTAAILMSDFAQSHQSSGSRVILAGTIPEVLHQITDLCFRTVDEALEWCEDQILAQMSVDHSAGETVPLEASDLGRGLTQEELVELTNIGTTRVIDNGVTLVVAGEPSLSMFLVTSGHLTAHVADRRVAAFGPGAIVGEMGLLTGGVRSATITADRICTLIEFTDLDGLESGLRAKLHRNIAVVLAGRLSASNRALVETRL
jgi:glutaminase